MADVTPQRRRRATQARSKITVQKILDATTALIVERGAQGVTMTEIARQADLVIGSLYQYFTDKSAIYRAILIQHSVEARALLNHYVAEVSSLEELGNALGDAFDTYFDLLQKDRFVIGLWSIVQTDPTLRALDLEDTLLNARFIANIAAPMLPGVDTSRLVSTFFIMIQFSFYAGHLARDMPAEIGRDFPNTYKFMLRESIASLKQASTV